MFEKAKLQEEIAGKKIEILELDYVKEAEYLALVREFGRNEKEIDDLITTDKNGDRKLKPKSEQKAGEIEIKNRTILSKAFEMIEITVDKKPLKNVNMFLKKIGHVKAITLFYKIYGIGRLTEDEKKK